MKIIIVKDYAKMSIEAANIIEQEIKQTPNCVLGLATGSTPEGMYRKLIDKKLDWSGVTTFNLDEYFGISETHPLSYHVYMKEKLFNFININIDKTYIPTSDITNTEAAHDYEEKIVKEGGIDLQILGIGENGHIGFNEPGSDSNGMTAIVSLTESTIKANSRYFKAVEDVPKKAISMGIGSIMKAKKIVLLASGLKKANAIKDSIEGKATNNVPASILQNHPNVTFIIDQEAAAKLKK